jgi:electron transfer flavoprotein beta subunit
MLLSVAVLVSSGRHPLTGRPRACPGDAAALELARGIAGPGLQVTHAGHVDDPALLDYLAFGAHRVTVVADEGDPVAALAAQLRSVDLIVTGTRTEQGEGSGLLPYALARALGRPIVANVLSARINGREAILRQFLPKGKRRGIAVRLPAVLAVHPMAPVALRYAHARKASGHVVMAEAPAKAREIGAAAGSAWTLSPADRQLVRLKAQEKKAGHARMLSAVAAEAKGGVVAIEGSDVEKAQMLLGYLREHRLIDF